MKEVTLTQYLMTEIDEDGDKFDDTIRAIGVVLTEIFGDHTLKSASWFRTDVGMDFGVTGTMDQLDDANKKIRRLGRGKLKFKILRGLGYKAISTA